jgi:hypothetical protein
MAGTITRETKNEGKKKGQKTHNSQEPKKGKKLVLIMIRSYFTHGPFNVTYMQIMKSNNNGRFKTSITYQCNFPLCSKG